MAAKLPTSFRFLGRRLDPAALARPAVEVGRELDDAHATWVLGLLITASNEVTLADVLSNPLACRYFDRVLDDHDARSLIRALDRWSRDVVASARERERAAQENAERAREQELVAWARERGVEAHLADAAQLLAPFLEVDPWLADGFRYFATGDVRRAALGRGGHRSISAEVAASAARRYLEHRAAQRQRAARRAELWRTTPEHPELARAASGLRELERALGIQARAVEAPLDAAEIELLPQVPALVVLSSASPRGSSLTLSLEEHERDAPRLASSGDAPLGLQLALVRIALDVVHDPEHALHAPLLEALARPAWQRFADRLESELALGPRVATERLVFRVIQHPDGTPRVELAIQRQSANGRWTKGARASYADARPLLPEHGPGATLAVHRLVSSVDDLASADALFALAGDPSVAVVSESGAPLSLQRVEARFALHELDTGIGPSAALGDVLVPFERIGPRVAAGHALAVYVPERSVVLVTAVDAAFAAIARAAARHPCVVPEAEQGSLMPLLERVATRVPVRLTPALEARARPIAPALFVRLVPDDQGATVELRVRLSTSLSESAGKGSSLVSVLEEGTATPTLRRRDLARESAAARELARELGLEGDSTRARIEDEESLVALLAALDARPELEVEWPHDAERTRYLGALARSSLRVSVRRAAQWFGVDGEIEIDGERISLAELLAQVRAGRRFVKLGRRRYAAIEADLRARLERAADAVFASGRGGLAVAATAGDALDDLAPEGGLRADAAWSRIRARLASSATEPVRVPRKLRATLRDYQREGFVWLARLASLEAGAVLADDMGLGKTLQALALLVHRASEGPALVVAPTSLSDNWAREAARFAPSLRVRLHRGPGRHDALASEPPRAGDVLVASYDLVTMDREALAELDLATLVLDEAQAVKNPEAQRTRAVLALRAGARVALTGTPIENRLSDLWSIFQIVHPGLLGPWEHFRARFVVPIERDGDRDRLAALSRLVRPYLLRRTKELVAPELPARIEILREVELSEAERRLYDAERADAIARLSDADESERFQVLASIARLRQLACDPSLVVPDAGVASSKLAALIELVEELDGARRKVLVFSQFVRLLERGAAMLAERGIPHLMLDGSTPAAERARLVERFQRGEATVFLLSLKAGGTGLNLTAADHVVHLDPWWNPAAEDQASDRAHRIGQDKPVTIVRLATKDTIEAAVLALHEDKRALSRGVLDGADAAGALSASQLVALIREGHAEVSAKPRRRKRAS